MPIREDRAERALVLRPFVGGAHDALRRWLDEHGRIRFVEVLDARQVAGLSNILAPRSVRVAPRWQGTDRPSVPHIIRQGLASLVGRYATIIVLCADDQEVVSGRSAFRIVGELLFGNKVALIGPESARIWPGGGGIFTYRRARELATIATTAIVAVATTSTAFAAIALEEGLVRLKLLR